MEEKVFLSEGKVKVTNARFMVPSQTFAMSGITSIKTSKEHPSRTSPIIVIAIGIGSLAGVKFFPLLALVALALIAVGGVWLYLTKTIFHIVLTSASGETKALSSKDRKWISKVIAALNDSIVHRG